MMRAKHDKVATSRGIDNIFDNLAFRDAHLNLNVGITLGNEIARLVQVRLNSLLNVFNRNARFLHFPRIDNREQLELSALATRATRRPVKGPRTARGSIDTDKNLFHHLSLSKNESRELPSGKSES